MNSKENLDNIAAIRRLLQVSPGSTILLRGHVDPTNIAEFRKQGGENYVRQMALRAMWFADRLKAANLQTSAAL